MSKLINWFKAVIAVNHTYSNMAAVDIKQSSEKLFEDSVKEKDENKRSLNKMNSVHIKPLITACGLPVVGLTFQIIGVIIKQENPFSISVLDYINILVFKPLCYTTAGYIFSIFISAIPPRYQGRCRI